MSLFRKVEPSSKRTLYLGNKGSIIKVTYFLTQVLFFFSKCEQFLIYSETTGADRKKGTNLWLCYSGKLHLHLKNQNQFSYVTDWVFFGWISYIPKSASNY